MISSLRGTVVQVSHPSFVVVEVGGVGFKVNVPGTVFDDLDGVAALISAFDLVIAPDTTVAALAGSLGQPVWRLTIPGGSWDMLGTAGCPWFPSMRVCQQTQYGDWSSVLVQVAEALVAWAASPRPSVRASTSPRGRGGFY